MPRNLQTPTLGEGSNWGRVRRTRPSSVCAEERLISLEIAIHENEFRAPESAASLGAVQCSSRGQARDIF
jgi:hypothetical protein